MYLHIVDAIDPNDIERIASQIDMAAKQAEDLRKRLQAHVEAHVNQLLSDGQVNGQMQVGAGNGNNAVAVPGQGGAPAVPQKLELKIDLPPDLAKLVNNGSSLKFHQTFGRKEDGQLGDLTESQITITDGKNTDVTVISGGSQPPTPPRDNNKQIDAPPPATPIQTAKLGSLCPLGTFSETGRATNLHGTTGCEPCPEGETTLKLGSDVCGVVAEVDLLNMFFDLMNGEYATHFHIFIPPSYTCLSDHSPYPLKLTQPNYYFQGTHGLKNKRMGGHLNCRCVNGQGLIAMIRAR